MTWVTILAIACQLITGVGIYRDVNRKPPKVPADLDARRCYLAPAERDDEEPWNFSHRHLACWPRRGVWMSGDRAFAWQVATVTR